MYLPGYMFDPTIFLVLIGAALCMLASASMNSTFSKYSKIRNKAGLTGQATAQQILQHAGLLDVKVQHISGNLTDHYDPRTKTVNLSDATFAATSVAAIGVAAHECGHAIQHAKGYVPLTIRSALVPVANIGSTIAWPLIFIGLIIGGTTSTTLLNIGIIAFSAAVLFQIVTLPVEFNASGRALKIIGSNGMLAPDEVGDARKVLTAAALTYVASAASSILQLLRLILISNRRSN